MNRESKAAADSFDRTFREMESLSSLQKADAYFATDEQGATVATQKKTGEDLKNVLTDRSTDGVGVSVRMERCGSCAVWRACAAEMRNYECLCMLAC